MHKPAANIERNINETKSELLPLFVTLLEYLNHWGSISESRSRKQKLSFLQSVVQSVQSKPSTLHSIVPAAPRQSWEVKQRNSEQQL